MNTTNPHDNLIKQIKQQRVALDTALQASKALKRDTLNTQYVTEDFHEAIAQLTLSIRDTESAIMRLGMVLKNLAPATNPYPNSYNADNAVVEPTADGLKL